MKQPKFWNASILALMVSLTSYAGTEQQLGPPINEDDKCLGAMLDRYIWVRGEGDWTQNKGLNERYQIAQKAYKKNQDHGFQTLLNGPWDRALVPLFNAQGEALFDSLLAADTTGLLLSGFTSDANGKILSLDGAENYLRTGSPIQLHGLILKAYEIFRGSKKSTLDELLHPNKDGEETFTNWATNTAAILTACGQMSTLKAYSCMNATKDLLKEVNYSGNMILPHIWVEFVTNPTLREGVRQSALIMIDRMKSGEQSNVFSDFVQGFIGAGLGKEEAIEASWKTLALYGNGGPNTGYRLTQYELPDEASHLVVGLSVIGTGISYLDFLQRFSGKNHYAFPKEISGTCLTPKPYHFWLNAYLARWLVRQGYTPQVAQMATFVTAKGYQVFRDVNNAAGGVDKILAKPADHPANQVIRIDLTLAASGVVFGSMVGKQSIKPISLSQGYQKLNEVRGSSQSLSQDRLSRLMVSDRLRILYFWDQLFHPNEVLKFYQNLQ